MARRVLQERAVAGDGLGQAASAATRGVIHATGYDRDQEREADYIALQYMKAGGFELAGATSALQKFHHCRLLTMNMLQHAGGCLKYPN